MAISNGSFETQGTGIQPGIADAWTITEVSTGQEYAEFTTSIVGLDTLTSALESFEEEWPAGNDGIVLSFSGYFVDLEPATFNAFYSAPTTREDFESKWGVGSQGVFDFDSCVSEFASFDSGESSGVEGVEDFEEGWPAGAVFVGSLLPGAVTWAQFDSGGTAESVEDFEELWDNAYNWEFPASGAGTELEFAVFHTTPLATDTIENFLYLKTDLEDVSVDPTTDIFTCAGHGLVDGWRVSFYAVDGQLPSGLYANTRYYVRDKTTDTFKVSATLGGPAMNIADYGYGDIYLRHDSRSWWITELEV